MSGCRALRVCGGFGQREGGSGRTRLVECQLIMGSRFGAGADAEARMSETSVAVQECEKTCGAARSPMWAGSLWVLHMGADAGGVGMCEWLVGWSLVNGEDGRGERHVEVETHVGGAELYLSWRSADVSFQRERL
jgi:hypothetical protein